MHVFASLCKTPSSIASTAGNCPCTTLGLVSNLLSLFSTPLSNTCPSSMSWSVPTMLQLSTTTCTGLALTLQHAIMSMMFPLTPCLRGLEVGVCFCASTGPISLKCLRLRRSSIFSPFPSMPYGNSPLSSLAHPRHALVSPIKTTGSDVAGSASKASPTS